MDSRVNVRVAELFPNAVGRRFGATVAAHSGLGIVVERAMYANWKGVIWASGTAALATRLP